MNILFVNYGDFTTNSLNHIAGFANTLSGMGHACAVAVPGGKESIAVIADPRFVPLTYAEALAHPLCFSGGRPADLIHAWTPREGVRKFVLAYQREAHARLVVHLEDNEEFLTATWLGQPLDELRSVSEVDLAEKNAPTLAHPRRYRHLLRAAEGVTVIVDPLRQFVPAGVPCMLLRPGLDFDRYRPIPPDVELRRELGLRDGEKVIVFTGSNTFANEPEMRELYEAVLLLNARGIPTRLVRTGFNSPDFQATLPAACQLHVLDLGFVEKSKLPSLLGLADVLVQPGRPGPFNDFRLPSKLPEFLGAGKPVILPAANLGRELRDGIDALILQTGAPTEIADACARVFADPGLAQRLGRHAGAFARQHFDLVANTRGLAEFYGKISSSPLRTGSTASLAGDETELVLSLRALAAEAHDSKAAALVTDLAELTLALERQEPAQGERRRLQHELDDWQNRYRLTEQHAGNLQRRLESELNGWRERYRLIEQHSVNLENQLRIVNQRARLAGRQAAQAQGQLQRFNEQMAEREIILEASRARIAGLEAEGDRLSEIIRAREIKIRTMQESFSWRSTQPLRYLRRQLIDPRRRQAVPAAAPAAPAGPSSAREDDPLIASNVDLPASWTLPPRQMLVGGWCLAKDGRRLTKVRAVLPDRTINGLYGLRRRDVLAAVRDQPHAEHSGWQVEIAFQPTDLFLALEAADESGAWHRFLHTGLQIVEGLSPLSASAYEQWIKFYDNAGLRPPGSATDEFLFRPPLISVIVPVYNTPERWLRRTIDSVRAQTYARWELCIADDASSEPHVRAVLEQAAAEDPRIKVCFREQNGHICAASNSALALATGEFVALLDHDDELTPDALYEIAAALDARPDADYLYSDEDKIDEDGHRYHPYFKPDWLPDLFLGQNYTSHFSAYRAALVRAVGGFRPGYEGSQDWDLTLRVIARTSPRHIVHIPKVLYHWRAIPGSTAFHVDAKGYTVDAARRALVDYFTARGERVDLFPVPGNNWRIRYQLPPDPPLVSLVIPTRNGLAFLQRCVDSILQKTTYPKYEIVVVDNRSDDDATLAYLRSLGDGSHPLLQAGHTVQLLRYDGPFNYSAINNYAVAQAKGELIGLLNNDLEVITPDWLEEMASQALRPEIGCVGAMLYYPNDTIQHAGVVLGLGGVAGHAFRHFPRGTHGIFNRARLVQNYSAVTAACLVVRKSVFEQVGGLDERGLAIAFNDIDFCLKVRAAGYRNLWTPFAEFYHHESASRGAEDTSEKMDRFRSEIGIMLKRWGPLLNQDPAYNPNLTFDFPDFSLASPPRLSLPAPLDAA